MKRTVNDFMPRILERGITVLDNITALPFYGEPHRTNGFVLCICNSGTLEVEYDLHACISSTRHITFMYPQHIILAKKSSPDYHSTLVVISDSFLSRIAGHPIFRNRFLSELDPSFQLSEEQYHQILNIIETMRIIEDSGIPSWQDNMVYLLEVLFRLTEHFFKMTHPNSGTHSTRKTDKFREAVFKHYRTHRDVKFYANILCLSPKHFSTVIKNETGHSPGYWIRKRVIEEAKLLLVTKPDLNIQDISNELNFEDQATFSRYFKHDTGMSPSAYRQRVDLW